MRGRELAQIDFLSGPAGPHRRQRRNDARIGINSAQRVGVPAFRAARVEQKIVKVPKNEVVVALGRRRPLSRSGVDLEKDLAIERAAREARLPGKPSCRRSCLICCGVDSVAMAARNLRIANLEQRAGARRIPAPSRCRAVAYTRTATGRECRHCRAAAFAANNREPAVR